MKFCPNCGAKLPSETVKFCPECGFKLAPAAEAPTGVVEPPATARLKSEKTFDLLKTDLAKSAGSLSKNIADELLEKWKTSGKYPQGMGRVIGMIAEQVLPSAVEVAVKSAVWQNEQSIEVGGHWETSVSTAFPLKLDTGLPLVGKVHIQEVKLTIKGNVDVNSNTVTELRIGSINL